MPLLSMKNICKAFEGVYANKNVNIEVEPGEIHVLLGENGAGKSTLMNILYGIYRKDSGEIFFEGKQVEFQSPKDAIAHMIGMVHQHFMLVPTLTVSQNITLGLKESGFPVSNRKAINQKITDLSKQYGLYVDPTVYVSELSVGEQQRVEILKLLYRKAKLLILDEPTAVLTPLEVKSFFQVLKKLKADGKSVILITHHIPEVMEIADQVTVLRDTESLITSSISDLTEQRLAELMIGRQLKHIKRLQNTVKNAKGLQVRNLHLKRDGVDKLKSVSFDIAPGEILGIAGVDGNGQHELAEAIMGISNADSGSVKLSDKDMSRLPINKRKQLGLGYISDDRLKDELLLNLNLQENMLLKLTEDPKVNFHGFVNRKELNEKTKNAISEFDIKTNSINSPIRYLSGGNQQKLVLAREFQAKPCALVISQPTRGLDIGATEFIREQIVAAKENGCSVLLISADLEEILSMSDRIAVIHSGEIMKILPNSSNINMTEIGLLMAGKKTTMDEKEACQ